MVSRRSRPLNLRNNTSEVDAGMARRRSPRLHPQTQASEEVAGVTPRRSPRLHPQIMSSADGAGVTRRRRRWRGTSPAAAASLPDDDDLLREILLRLPPQPSSLHRASAVCKRWRGLVTDPQFLRQFYAHHRKPPILASSSASARRGSCSPPCLTLPTASLLNASPLDATAAARIMVCTIAATVSSSSKTGCGMRSLCASLCDPITGEQRQVSVPPEFKSGFIDGAVVCAASDLGHVHGGCHSSPFKVVLVSTGRKYNQQLACVYSSQSGIWVNLIATEASCLLPGKPAVLVGNCLYWLSMTIDILEFDLDKNNLTVISGPPVTNDTSYENWQIIQAEDGAIGYAIFCYPRFHIWQMNANDHGVATWVPWKTIEMHSILKLPPHIEGAMRQIEILGYNEDSGVIFLYVDASFYTVQLMSMQSRKLCGTHQIISYYPFTSFCTPGRDIGILLVNDT